MQGSKDLSLLPFGGSLHRKASHTTYGRRGRATLAAKDGSKTQDIATRESPNSDSVPVDQENSQLVAEHRRENGNGDSVRKRPPRSLRQNPSKSASGGIKRKHATDATEAADTAEIVERRQGEYLLHVSGVLLWYSPALEPVDMKRRRVDGKDQATPTSASTARNARSPSSDLSELPSEFSDMEATTPKPARKDPVTIKKTSDTPTAPENQMTPIHRAQTPGKRESGDNTTSKPPPQSTTFLPAIVPSPEATQGSQPTAFPLRRKARMLSRAESFGRTEAQKDQKELGHRESLDNGHGSGLGDSAEASSVPNPTSPVTVPVSPRKMLARSNTLATAKFSPSRKPRQALSRTTSMPTSPAQLPNASGLAADPEKAAMPSSSAVAVKRTYGKARAMDPQRMHNQHLAEEIHESGKLSPGSQTPTSVEKSHISPARHPLEQRESYADLVQRLEMDDEETLDWEESAGSMVRIL